VIERLEPHECPRHFPFVAAFKEAAPVKPLRGYVNVLRSGRSALCVHPYT
jgi:hypothetical protein